MNALAAAKRLSSQRGGSDREIEREREGQESWLHVPPPPPPSTMGVGGPSHRVECNNTVHLRPTGRLGNGIHEGAVNAVC